MSIEAMKQALEALEYHQEQTRPIHKTQETITTLRQAIEQAEKQEPVAYKYTDKTNPLVYYFTDREDVTPNPDVIETALYTAPPDVKHWKDLAEYRLQLLMKLPEQKEWVGLTDEGIDDAWRSLAILSNKGLQELRREYARSIEKLSKEKNNG
jgi:hypothetical protein